MRALILLVLCLTLSLLGFSQATTVSTLNNLSDQFSFEKSKGNAINGASSFNNIEGSPYLNKEFVPGEVVINDSIRIKEIPLRYNIYSDKIEFLDNQQQVLEIDMSKQSSYNFKIGDLCFTPLVYRDNGQKEYGILEVIVEGNIRLYKKYVVDFEPATKAIGYQDAKTDRFIRMEDEYLLAIGEGTPELFKSSKNVIEKLQKIKPDIKQYAKNKKIKTKSEKGLIALIQYCNNL